MSVAPLVREDDLLFLRRLVQERSAIVLDENKDYLIEARLAPLATREGFKSLADLLAALRKSPTPAGLVKSVVEAMTTNETSFFRDIAPFDCLRARVLPEVVAARGESKRLRIWCAACSSGQEPYSILFLIRDAFPELDSWRIELLATDLSSAMVERTRAGAYSQLEVNRGLPARMVLNNFARKGVKWEVKSELRQLVEARELNLIEPWPPMPEQDIVFLRNVLIYFDVPTKQSILRRVKSVLAKDGFLFLGGAETTVAVDDDFERVDFTNASCYRLHASAR